MRALTQVGLEDALYQGERWVVFDAMGVLYRAGDDVTDVLLPYLRSRGCLLDAAEIERVYRLASLGRCSSTELWGQLGVEADDVAYCSGHALMPGIEALLKDLHRYGIPMACLSNDVSEWSRVLRRHYQLERWIPEWVVSGDIGVRKPDPVAYETLARVVGTAGPGLIFFDDRARNVTAAEAAGLDAILFTDVQRCRQALADRGMLPPAPP